MIVDFADSWFFAWVAEFAWADALRIHASLIRGAIGFGGAVNFYASNFRISLKSVWTLANGSMIVSVTLGIDTTCAIVWSANVYANTVPTNLLSTAFIVIKAS